MDTNNPGNKTKLEAIASNWHGFGLTSDWLKFHHMAYMEGSNSHVSFGWRPGSTPNRDISSDQRLTQMSTAV